MIQSSLFQLCYNRTHHQQIGLWCWLMLEPHFSRLKRRWNQIVDIQASFQPDSSAHSYKCIPLRNIWGTRISWENRHLWVSCGHLKTHVPQLMYVIWCAWLKYVGSHIYCATADKNCWWLFLNMQDVTYLLTKVLLFAFDFQIFKKNVSKKKKQKQS